jgi:predicted nucleic acid-binding protein
MRTWLRFPVQEITVSALSNALDIKERYRVSYWDAAIVAAARQLGCDTLLTEDLGHGLTMDGVAIQDPFRQVPG